MSQLRQSTQSVRLFSRLFGTTALRSSPSVAEDFENAKKRLNTLKEDPGNQAKLDLYALFKQATMGKCTGSRPGMTDFVGRAKWDAWNALGDISKEDAQKKYISTVNGLAGDSTTSVSESEASSGSGDVISTVRDKMHIITLNRPTKKNAIKVAMYDEIVAALDRAAKDDTTLAVLTGAGDFYCSGNDLSNFLNVTPETIVKMTSDSQVLLQRYVAAFIDFPKPLIAVVNGPAVGISVTVLALFDAVYATDRATFHTPFSALGQSPEGCSSYLFPKMMGYAAACEMLLFNRKLTANEAKQKGLVSEVFPDASFQRDVWERVKSQAKLPPGALRESKAVIRKRERDLLHEVNKRECEVLCERWRSTECANAVMDFFTRKQ